MATIPSYEALNEGLGNRYLPFGGQGINLPIGPPGFINRNFTEEDEAYLEENMPYGGEIPIELLRDLPLYQALGGHNTFGYPGGRGRGLEYYQGQYPAMDEDIISLKEIQDRNLDQYTYKSDPNKFFDPGAFANAGIRSIPFGTSVDNYQGFTDKTARESEEEEQQNFFQKLMNNSFMANLIQGIGSLFKPTQSGIATRDLVRRGYGPTLQNLYGPGGLMQGYNMISHRGPGPIGSITNRRNKILKRIAEGKNYSEGNLQKLNQAITSLGGDAQQPSLANFATKKVAAKSPGVGMSGYTKADDAREARRGQYG